MQKAFALIMLAAVLCLGAGCKSYHYIVRTNGAPLYEDDDRREIATKMERLEDGVVKDLDEDPVKIRYRGMTGYANRKDIRVFRCDEREARNHDHTVFWNRREVHLEGKDWPEGVKQAIRDSRVENGMTREQVELAWGRPTGTQSLEGGAEKWTFTRTKWNVHEDVHYDYRPGGPRMIYGYGPWGPSFGYGYEFSRYEPHYYRTYYAREERRSVTFGADGKVTGWEASAER